MQSFGLNDGRPNGEIVIEVDDNGAVTSAKNVITNTEYVGGGGDLEVVEVKFVRGTATGAITLNVCEASVYDDIPMSYNMPYLNFNENEKTIKIILYKGYAALWSNDFTFSGDNWDEENEVITGAGTITVNAS